MADGAVAIGPVRESSAAAAGSAEDSNAVPTVVTKEPLLAPAGIPRSRGISATLATLTLTVPRSGLQRELAASGIHYGLTGGEPRNMRLLEIAHAGRGVRRAEGKCESV